MERIVILNLESYSSGPAIQFLVESLGKKIIAIYSSDRFGGKYGSFTKQLINNLKKSGLNFVVYLAINLTCFKFFRFVRNAFSAHTDKINSVKELAKKYGILYARTKNINGDFVVNDLKRLNPGLVISFHFDQIVGEKIIAVPTHGIVNVHGALLPMCRGPFPVFCSRLKDIRLGFTLHFITDLGIDSGPILQKSEVTIDSNCSLLKAEEKILLESAKALVKLVTKEFYLEYETTEQRDGFYYSFPPKTDVRALINKGVKLFRTSDLYN